MFKKRKPTPYVPRTNIGGQELPVSVRESPIVGYRIWNVRPTVEGLALWSLNTMYEWDIHNKAECIPPPTRPFMTPSSVGPVHPEPAPYVHCSCGFYVSLPDQPLQEWEHVVYNKVHATGSVALTGRVLRCTLGYKAEHAEIISPVVLNAACASSASCMEEVVQIDLQTQYARGWCAKHAPGVGVVVEAGQYMRHASEQLAVKYPNIEFLSWFTI